MGRGRVGAGKIPIARPKTRDWPSFSQAISNHAEAVRERLTGWLLLLVTQQKFMFVAIIRVGGRPRHIYFYTASGRPAPGQVVPGGNLADSRPWIFSTALNPGESGRQAGCESDRFYHPTKYTSGLTNLRIE